jgi:hypothetical protein
MFDPQAIKASSRSSSRFLSGCWHTLTSTKGFVERPQENSVGLMLVHQLV